MKEKKRESPAGYHFYYAYLDNPGSWYIKYILGLKPVFTPPPLIKGGCVHEAIEAYYTGSRELELLLGTYEHELSSRREEYENQEQYTKDMFMGLGMLEHWHNTWHDYDLEHYDILEVEQGYEFNIGPGGSLRFTVRPDRIVYSKAMKRAFVADVKTTSYSTSKAMKQVAAENQITSYIWAMQKAHPEWDVTSGIADVMYARMNKSGTLGSQESIRSEFIYRTQKDLVVFELNLVGLIIEITQKVKALATTPAPLLFPWNGRMAGLFGDVYEEIHHMELKPGQIPSGFIRDDWHEVDELVEAIDLSTWQEYLQEGNNYVAKR